jgi:hypothetical protein
LYICNRKLKQIKNMEITFKELNNRIKQQFDVMQQHKLFRLKTTGQEIWDTYLAGFKPNQNPVFRDPNSSEANANNDKNFIRRYGNIVAITPDYKVISMFDINVDGTKYEDTVKGLQKLVTNSEIGEVFFETFDELHSLPYEKTAKTQSKFQLGHEKTLKKYTQEEVDKFGVVNTNDIYQFDHFYVLLNKDYVDMTGKSVESIMGTYRDAKNVFQRAMEEIPLDTLNLVKDLINQGSLLDGQTHLYKVEQFIPLKREYNALAKNQKDVWCWLKSYQLPFAKFKNELIGVLCSELAEGKELNEACQAWNKRVDPANYMKATAPITKKQIEEARKFVEENGYEESFDRRFATIDDIKVSEILHSNVGDGKIKSVSIFDNVKSTSTRHKRSEFDKVEEISIDKFMKDILPTCTSVEAFLQNNHQGNLVTLTTANVSDSKLIFKWSNNYSWTFNGNLAGKSQIKDAVKSRGGETEGVLRVSLAFPNTTDDYDLHLVEPNRNEICFTNLRMKHNSSGMLDLDAQGKDGNQPAEKRVENIIYTDKSRMPEGTYQVYVNNYSRRGLHTPFTLEVEAEGEVTLLELSGKTVDNKVLVASIEFNGTNFNITPSNNMTVLESNSVSKEIYGLETNKFQKVNLVCLSPNHWEGNNVGNKHYFFMLEGCKCDTSIRSFHNENLIPELLQHRKVMEVLGATNMIEPTDKQLSGLGFNATTKEELVVRLQGTHKRVLKIKF